MLNGENSGEKKKATRVHPKVTHLVYCPPSENRVPAVDKLVARPRAKVGNTLGQCREKQGVSPVVTMAGHHLPKS